MKDVSAEEALPDVYWGDLDVIGGIALGAVSLGYTLCALRINN